MNAAMNASSKQEPAATEAGAVEPGSGEMTEDELEEAVGGVGPADEQDSQPDESSGGGWWNDPNS
jgi:hypothetical protein